MKCNITDKIIYKSKQIALQAGIKNCRRSTWIGNPPTVYKCEFCRKWHITSKTKPRFLKLPTLSAI